MRPQLFSRIRVDFRIVFEAGAAAPTSNGEGRTRGRPRKSDVAATPAAAASATKGAERGRGRPRKSDAVPSPKPGAEASVEEPSEDEMKGDDEEVEQGDKSGDEEALEEGAEDEKREDGQSP